VTFDVSAASDLPDPDPSNNSAKATTTVSSTTRPANDNFLNPLQLSGLSGTISGTNVGATREIPIDYGFLRQDPFELNHAGVNGGKSVWYYWTPPANKVGSMSVDTSGSNFDTVLAVYSVDTSTIELQAEISSNDDVLNTPISAVNFTFDSKHVYYFVVDGKQGATGQIKLNWRAVVFADPSGKVQQSIKYGIYPSITCTSTSNAPDICDKDKDTSGNFVMHVKGQNFTRDSRVEVKGYDILSLPQGQIEYLGQSGSTYNELVVHIPPNPPLGEITRESVRVVTLDTSPSGGSPATALVQTSNKPDAASIGVLPDGTYKVAYGSRGLNTFEVQFIELKPGEKKTVCLNLLHSGDVCIEIENKDTRTIKLTPSYFTQISNCDSATGEDAFEQCRNNLNTSNGTGEFALNPNSAFFSKWTLKQKLNLSTPVINALRSANGKIAMGVEGGKTVAGLVAAGAGNLITNDGGTLITNDGGTVVSDDGASLITNDGGTLIGNAGTTVVSDDGASLITNDGGTLFGRDGSTFIQKNGQPGIVSGGLAAALVEAFVSGKDASSVLASGRQQPAASSSSGGGVKGLILAKSSGGQEPTFTTETDPVTGEVTGFLTITLDDTSFPRAFNVKGMAFSVLVNPAVVQFAANNVTVDKAAGRATVALTRTGDKSGSMTVDYATGNGTGNDRSDYTPVFGSVRFAPGETSKDVTIPLINNGYGTSEFGAQRTFNLIIVNVIGGAIQAPNFTTVTITNNQSSTSPVNPLDVSDADFFVRQQYLDFLGREPDANGSGFWKSSITACGGNQQCIEAKRINASAAFFLSIEFQGTGYFLERINKAAYGSTSATSVLGGSHQIPVPIVRFSEFLIDKQKIANGVVVGQAGWDTLLENNKRAFAGEFVGRQKFTSAFPATMTEAQFVGQLNANVGGLLSTAELTPLVADLNSGTTTRAQVLRAVADNQKLVDVEFNRAFVLMQYFGYLRRNPNEGQDTDYTGFEFWLNKLNTFNGNWNNAEMVRAFINSAEYRKRLGPEIVLALIGAARIGRAATRVQGQSRDVFVARWAGSLRNIYRTFLSASSARMNHAVARLAAQAWGSQSSSNSLNCTEEGFGPKVSWGRGPKFG